MKTRSKLRKSVLLRLALMAVAAAGTLLSSGCTYNEVMQERTTENNYLRGQLAEEEARGARLSY
jgi:hypothetical protein